MEKAKASTAALPYMFGAASFAGCTIVTAFTGDVVLAAVCGAALVFFVLAVFAVIADAIVREFKKLNQTTAKK